MNQIAELSAPALPVTSGPELAIIVPTFNEAGNVAELVRRLDAALTGIAWEVIFVDDDSPDGTAGVVRDLSRHDPRVRCLRRIGRRGLSSACIEGMFATSAPMLAVMDGDLQHDETILPAMLARLRSGEAGLAVGSRYAPGGSTGDWDARRRGASRLATRLGQLATGVDLADPMSGFFMLRATTFDGLARRLSGYSFKILLDILASAPERLRVAEVPYTFRLRQHGESKLDSAALVEFGMLLLDKTLGRWLPVKFLMFCLVGGLGLVVHLIVLSLVLKGLGAGFGTGQTVATIAAMTFNFFVNNAVTYRDRRLKGWAMLGGLVSFMAACSVGAAANIGVAVYAFDHVIAGARFDWVWSAAAGVAVGAVWNYAVTALYTWGRKG